MDDKLKYERWHEARADSMNRGTDLSALNAGTMMVLHEHALKQDREFMKRVRFSIGDIVISSLDNMWL